MAKEKKEKIPKVNEASGKSVLVIGVVLIVCSIILSIISGYMLVKAMDKKTEVMESTREPGNLPLTQIESYETDNIVLQLNSTSDPEKTMNFTFYVGFMLDKKDKQLEATKELLEEQKNVIKSKISGLLKTKSVEEMLRPDSQDIIAKEIYVLMIELLQTDTLDNVYIRDFLYR